MLRFVALLLVSSAISLAGAHEHHGDESGPSCEMNPDVRVLAEFRPGIVTVDGHVDDWDDVEGSEFPLLPALDPDQDKAYGEGKLTVKVCISQKKEKKNPFFIFFWVKKR